MTDRTFEIFRTPEAIVQWDKHLEHIDAVAELSAEEKAGAKEALSYLRQRDVLGEAFIERARRTGHPLYSYFRNTVPWTRRWLTRFAAALRELRSADGFAECMQNEIKEADKFTERESVLEVAYKFFNAGFAVAFDPAVTVAKPRGFTGRLLPTEAVPDLRLVDRETEQELFIEVSALGESDVSKQSGRTYHTVFDVLVTDALWRGRLFPRARTKRILEDDELKALVAQLRELIAEVQSSNDVCYLINDEIEACLAPEHLQHVPDQWGTERGITAIPIEGPSIPLRDPLRTSRIIRKEQRQLPADKPGIVVITTDWTLLFFAHGLGDIAAELEVALRPIPKLSCAVISCTYQGGEVEGYVACEGPHTAVKRATETGLIEQTIISFNSSCAFPLLPAVIDRIRGAFIKG